MARIPDARSDELAAEKMRHSDRGQSFAGTNSPTPNELFFEAGLVIAGALGVTLLMQLLLAATGIPNPA